MLLHADQAFGRSLLFLRRPDYALLIAAGVGVVLRPHDAIIAFAAVTIAMSATAIGAWRFATRATVERVHVGTFRWKEATAYLAVHCLFQGSRTIHPVLELTNLCSDRHGSNGFF